MTSGVDGKTYGSTADRSAGLLISSFISAAILPPTPAKVGGCEIWVRRLLSTSSTQRAARRSYPQPVSAIQHSGRDTWDAHRPTEACWGGRAAAGIGVLRSLMCTHARFNAHLASHHQPPQPPAQGPTASHPEAERVFYTKDRCRLGALYNVHFFGRVVRDVTKPHTI